MSPHTPLPDFDLIASSIDHGNPAEIHGMLCGMLCVDGHTPAQHWLDQVNSEAPEINLMGQGILRELFDATVTQLDDLELSFRLLLPDDDQGLSERTEALSYWCQGFLYGLGLVVDSDRQLPTELREFFGDLNRLSQVDFLDTDEASDSDEADYTEIVEYIRVGVMLTNQELQTRGPGDHPAQIH